MTFTTSTTTTKKNKNTPAETALDLSANFANNRKGAVGYDHEVYLQLTAGRNAEKTPNQVYREVGRLLFFFFCPFLFPFLFFSEGQDVIIYDMTCPLMD